MMFRASVPQSAWMDDATSRTRSTSRRMASAKGGGTTGRASSSRSPKKGQEPAVSPARWAGVALVIAAIVGAVFLAMISPSEPGDPDQPAQPGEIAAVSSPGASPAATDTNVPTVQPVIVSPFDGEVTPEIEIAVTVEVPAGEEVPKRLLDLFVHNGSQIYKYEKPKSGTTVKVEGVRLTPGENTLTASLGAPGGPGPTSVPILLTLDEDAPKLTITSPKKKTETYDNAITVEFTSEVEATVRVVNSANKFDDERVVGPSGKDSILVNLKRGKNLIEASSIDSAGLEQTAEVNVIRLDGRPTIKIKAPGTVAPPESARIVVDVTDAKGKPMPDAEVYFTLAGPNRTALEGFIVTNERGRAVWNPDITGSSSPADALELGVVVISPTGGRGTGDATIALR